MLKRTQVALNDAVEWLGDWHPLAEQLGSADGLLELGTVTACLRIGPVLDVSSLKSLLQSYQAQVLLPIELPAIQTAHDHCRRNELRELVMRDQELSKVRLLDNFAPASRRIGQAQLQKLRPLRDERFVQRYLQAVESGEANGWHTLVYGLTLAVYSLPVTQGLLGYAHQSARGFIYSAARPLRLSEHECRDIFNEACADLPQAIELLLRQPAAA
jgi:urease accessory protein UreF